MGSVDQNLCSNGRIRDTELQHICKGILFAVYHCLQFGIDIKASRLLRRIGEGIVYRCSCSNHAVLANL